MLKPPSAAKPPVAAVGASQTALVGLAAELRDARQQTGRVQRELQVERALGRIRDRIIALRRLDEVPGKLEEAWVQELRSLGIPINRTSLQFPSAREGYLSLYRDAFLSDKQAASGRLADYPWVGEAWASGQAIIVGRQRLEQAKFPAEVRSLIELPLPGGGSLGVNSLQEEAFDEEAVQILQQVAGLLSQGIERLRELEILRRAEESQRIELAVQQVRDAVLQMKDPEDWTGVGAVLRRQLAQLVAFDGAGIAIVNRECWSFYAYDLTESGAVKGELCDFLPRALGQAVESGKPVLRRNRAEMEEWRDNVGPERHSVVDVPFDKGTLSLNSVREDAFSERDIAVLMRFAGVITEAHLRLEALQQLKRFAAIIEESTDFIGICDPQGWMLYLNRAGRRLVGVGEDDDITLTRATDYLPEQMHGLIDEVARQGSWQGVGVLRRKDGSEVSVLHGALAHRGVDGQIELLSTIARDISQQQQAEGHLRVGLALQQVRNAILLIESENDWLKVVETFDQQLRKLLRYDYCSINAVDQDQEQVLAYSTGPEGICEQIRVDRLPRALVDAMATGVPVHRANRQQMLAYGDTITRIVGSVVDVPFSGGTVALSAKVEEAFGDREIEILTQFAQVMNEGYRRLADLKTLRQTQHQLYQGSRLEAVGQLATGVAHELNNPLTSVIGYADLLLRRPVDDDMRAYLETILVEGQRAERIVTRLLSFARRQRAERQWIPLPAVVEEALLLVRQPYLAAGVEVRTEAEPDPLLVQVHPGQIQQVVLALVQNSHDALASAQRGGTVTVRLSRAGEWVRVEVGDDGPGIPPAIRERIFEPFFTTKTVGKGPGLGLSICHAIVQEHGGRLWAEPCATGACLVVELPAGDPAPQSPSEEIGDGEI